MKQRLSQLRCWLVLFSLAASLQITLGYYDPAAQRWINRDPIAESGGVNLYTACANDPVSDFDAMGLCGDDLGSDFQETRNWFQTVKAASNLDECLDACDKKLDASLKNQRKECYCYCWTKFRPSKRLKTTQQLIAEWKRSHPGQEWPICANGKPAEADHINPLADGGDDNGSNIQPLCPDEHKKKHKPDKKRWGKRSGRKCEPSDPEGVE